MDTWLNHKRQKPLQKQELDYKNGTGVKRKAGARRLYPEASWQDRPSPATPPVV